MTKTKTEAFILKKKSLLNKDLLITVFSQEFGKLTLLAKGARTITSRRLPHIQTGNLVNIMFNTKGSMNFLGETSLISGFSQIRDSSSKLNHKYFLLFILDRLLAEEQTEYEIYNLVKKFFIELSISEKFNEDNVEKHLNKILVKLGYIQEQKPFYQLTEIIESLIHEKAPLYAI